MSVNIEHISIDQDTEYAVEEVLSYSKKFGYEGNFATAEFQDREFLPEGNVIAFLDKILEIAFDIISQTKSPRQKWRLQSDILKISNLRNAQAEYYAENEKFMGFPTSPHSTLSNHLLNGVDLAE